MKLGNAGGAKGSRKVDMTEKKQIEKAPVEVGNNPIQAGETITILPTGWYSWVESCVWTQSMSIALLRGVKGGKWFSLIDKVFKPANLLSAFNRVKKNQGTAGIDHVSINDFEKKLEENLERLQTGLEENKYTPQAIKRVEIPKPGTKETRPLGIPTIRDRVVQAAVLNVIEPIFEIDFAEHSYGFRPKRGAKDALRRVDKLLKEDYTIVVDADLKGYFDSIPHEVIMNRIEEKISDGRVIELIEKFLQQPVQIDDQLVKPKTGTPQGAVLSPLLANAVLDPLDKLMQEHGFQMTRYADDFVIQCRTEKDAETALNLVKTWVLENGLTLHPDKTKIINLEKGEGFDFLGYNFFRHSSGKLRKYPREKSRKKFRDTIRMKTSKLRGESIEKIIKDINQTTKGWFEYFKHAYKHTFEMCDSFTRRRLRRILRKRLKKRGGTGQNILDHLKWPNAYFTELGLFSMETAYNEAILPLRR